MSDRLRELAREWLNQRRGYVSYSTGEDWRSLTDLLARVEREAKEEQRGKDAQMIAELGEWICAAAIRTGGIHE